MTCIEKVKYRRQVRKALLIFGMEGWNRKRIAALFRLSGQTIDYHYAVFMREVGGTPHKADMQLLAHGVNCGMVAIPEREK